MHTLLDEPAMVQNTAAADRLRATMAAVRVCFTWFGIKRSLNADQQAEAAEALGATGEYLSAFTKLLDNNHEAFKKVTVVRGRISSLWKGMSLPYPEPGIRLVRQDDIAPMTVQLTTLRAELEEAVEGLNQHYNELKS